MARPGELLREARRRHGLTQVELARRARTSQAAISRIERGLVSPSVAMLERLLELAGERLTLGTKPLEDGVDRSARTSDGRRRNGSTTSRASRAS